MHTPMMKQYLEIKARHKDAFVFFRMGDFYELFFEDAQIAAPLLDIVLTKRGEVSMCGVPASSYEGYVSRLLSKGHRIAICEQLEPPGKKGLIKRDVVRILTPGTVMEDHLLPSAHSQLLAVFSPLHSDGSFGVAVCDVSTGMMRLETHTSRLKALLHLEPHEILAPSTIVQEKEFIECERILRFHLLPLAKFEEKNALERLKSHLQVKALDAFKIADPSQIQAASALLDYLELTHQTLPVHIKPQIISPQHLEVDHITRQHLEITRTLTGTFQGSLLWSIDHTLTAFGKRLLKDHVMYPLRDKNQLEKRFDSIDEVIIDQKYEKIRSHLKTCPDAERALSRIVIQKAFPRDLVVIKSFLEIAAHLSSYISYQNQDLLILLSEALDEQGGIKDGYSKDLDHYRYLQAHSQDELRLLEKKYQEETGITTLKIKHNYIVGYHIDVSAGQAVKAPSSFIHKQNMTGRVRYTTTLLQELESNITQNTMNVQLAEQEIFTHLFQNVFSHYDALKNTVQQIAELDVATSFAFLAVTQSYVRPHLTQKSIIKITKGRHPVIEKTVHPFTSNDLDLDENMILLTGPNMAGKSTYLRQTALHVFLAQIGCFVPAEKAIIGLCDRVFTRIGARDDLSTGRSTFMVEMIETATILHQATPQSLVIVDEIGRGTSTYDGLSIAWATCEALHKHCRTLFATHYHELHHLNLPGISFYKMDVQEWQNDIIFLYQVTQGMAEKSYGLHVAKLAGFPQNVLDRAHEVLIRLENGHE